MDFRNLCHNINMDTIRAKIPSLPALPRKMPDIKLPKCMKKLKSFRFFLKSNNDFQSDVSRRATNQSQRTNERFTSLYRSEHVQHTPVRISTISSLMYQIDDNYNLNEKNERTTYRRAASIDDYPTPLGQKQDLNNKGLNAMKNQALFIDKESPALETSQDMKLLSFSECFQKTRQKLSDFKLRNIFNKETVVRKDNIGVDYYVEKYEKDRQCDRLEQEERDRKIADNYDFKFKTPREINGDSFDESTDDEITPRKNMPPKRSIRSVSEHSGDESGMELSPPKRKVDNVTNKFLKTRKTPLNTIQDDYQKNDNEEQYHKNIDSAAFNESTVFKIKNKKIEYEQTSSEKQEDNTGEGKPLRAIKHNFKLIQKSMKLPTSNANNSVQNSSSCDVDNADKEHQSHKLRERLKRIRSQSNSEEQSNRNESPTSKSNRTELAIKLQNLKKTFQKTRPESDNIPEVHVSKISRDSLITKLKNIRTLKQTSNDPDDPDDDEQHRTTSKESLVARAKLQLEKGVVLASQVPQRTMKKISESKRYFQRSQTESQTESGVEKTPVTQQQYESNFCTSNKDLSCYPKEDDFVSKQEYFKAMAENQEEIAAHKNSVAWTTKPILNDSVDLTFDEDDDVNYTPKILIHQDDSDTFESTLFVAVSRSRSQTPAPIVTQLSTECSKPCITVKQEEEQQPNTLNNTFEWIPNKEAISKFLNESPSPTEFNVNNIRYKLKRQSLDSSNPSSTDKRNKRDIQYNSAVELHVPIKEKNMKIPIADKKFYRPRSVDIFETTSNKNDVKVAFENFDAELEQVPIIEIKRNYHGQIRDVDGFERDSSEELDAADDDNSSRVTKILAPLKQVNIPRSVSPPIIEKNSIDNKVIDLSIAKQKKSDLCETNGNITTLITENLQTTTSSQLTSNSITPSHGKLPKLLPPPLPKSKPPPLSLEQSFAIQRKELKLKKPLIIPQRNITRVRKPLVKTSSLRLTYTEQVHPKDVDCSDEEEDFIYNRSTTDIDREYERDVVTPTNESMRLKGEDINRNIKDLDKPSLPHPIIKFNMISPHGFDTSLSNIRDSNSNFSGSEYGSPTTPTLSLFGSTEATPLSDRKQQDLSLNIRRHNRRSTTCDDDKFLSFDSDEDNSYYSISSTNSGRYVVDL